MSSNLQSLKKAMNITLLLLSIAAWASVSQGCAGAVVGAGAGAVGAMAYTDRGAKGHVAGSVSAINQRAAAVLGNNGLQTVSTNSKDAGKERSIEAKKADKDVTVDMKASGNNVTEVEVIAKEGTLKWNKDYAKSILQQIITG